MGTRGSIRLSLRTPSSGRKQPHTRIPWWGAAMAGAGIVAVGGWIVVVGFTVLGWLAGSTGSLGGAIGAGTRLWFLIHGAPADIGPVHLSMIPLLPTFVVGACLAAVAGFATRQAQLLSTDLPLRSVVLKPAMATLGTYLALVVVTATMAVAPTEAARAFVTTAIVAGAGSLIGSIRAVQVPLTAGWPPWARSLPTAVALALGVLLTISALALVWTFLAHRTQVSAIHDALAPGNAGGAALLLMQVSYLPNMLLWALAYVLGGGFTVGEETLVSIANTHVGLLPSIPAFGALPVTSGQWYQYLWLLAGVAAGAIAAWVVVRSRPRASVDETALTGALAGVLAAVVVVVAAGLSRGGLGMHRLAEMGPRMTELAVVATSLLGLSGAAAGAVMGLLRPRVGADADVD